MQQPSQTNFSHEDFMAFFNDSQNIDLLSIEDKMLIASRLIAQDQNLLPHLLAKSIGRYDSSIQQILQERNSLPVF